MFNDKKLMITGGTGSFGNAVMKRFLNTDIREIHHLYSMHPENLALVKNHKYKHS